MPIKKLIELTVMFPDIMVPNYGTHSPQKKETRKRGMGDFLYPKLEVFALFYCKQEAFNENSTATKIEKRQYAKISIMVHFYN